jgi:hypothetical protein
MESSLYAHPEDLRGEGIERVADRALGYGCDGLTIAAAYHRARDVTPHGRSRVTVRRDGVHFPLPADLWDGTRLVPPSQDGADDGLFAELRRVTTQRGARLHGWTVFLHNTTLGLAHPDVTQENCFGDRAAPADLCPSHPDVRAYATALARSVARLGVDTVLAESLHFGFFGHGYHHERCFVELGPVADGYAILGYARDPARLSADVAAYRSALGESGRLRVTLRPGLPDTPSAANLAEKLRLVAAVADAVDFYSYGLFPLPVLDRIPAGLKAGALRPNLVASGACVAWPPAWRHRDHPASSQGARAPRRRPGHANRGRLRHRRRRGLAPGGGPASRRA